MANKRPAEQTIDQKTLEYQTTPSQLSRTTNPQPRNIVQVKRDGDEPQPKKEVNPEDQKEQTAKQAPKPLFANLFQNNKAGVGLFSNVGIFSAAKQGLLKTSTEQPKIKLEGPNLFTGNGFSATSQGTSTNQTGSSLFSNNQASSSLFSSNQVGSSLFGSNNGPSIFNFGQGGSIPPVKSGGGGQEEEGDSAELENAQQMNIDKSKSKGHYDYKQQVKVLFSGLARKYKRNNGDLIEGVEIVLQQDVKNKLVYLTVRLTATKHNIFTGYILEAKSHVRILNNKKENLEVAAFTITKEKPTQLDKLKLQLDTPETGHELYLKLQDAIAGKFATEPTRQENTGTQQQKRQDESTPKQPEAGKAQTEQKK